MRGNKYEDIIDILDEFIEYATNTRKFHDVGSYEKIKKYIEANKKQLEKEVSSDR